jgi:addiction module RelE/StbE family toxin
MKIFFTPRFRRSYKRLVSKNEKLRNLVAERMAIFEKNPQSPPLKNHPLQGKLTGYRAFSLAFDLRALYRKEKDTYIFFDIGTHREVYE